MEALCEVCGGTGEIPQDSITVYIEEDYDNPTHGTIWDKLTGSKDYLPMEEIVQRGIKAYEQGKMISGPSAIVAAIATQAKFE